MWAFSPLLPGGAQQLASAGGDFGVEAPAPLPHWSSLLVDGPKVLAGEAGSFALTGQDAAFAYRYVSDETTFALTGQAATFGGSLVATHSAFTLSGQDAALLESTSAGVSAPAPLPHFSTLLEENSNPSLSAGEGTFAHTGQDAAFVAAMPGAEGAFTLTGQDGAFGVAAVGGLGSYVFNGQAAAFAGTLAGGHGAFTLTGQDGAFGLTLTAVNGAFTFTGQDASLDEGSTTGGVSAPAPLPHFSLILEAADPYELTVGSFALTGQDAALGIGLVSANVSFTLTGQAATFREGLGLQAERGSFAVTGFPTDPENTILRILMRAGEGVFAFTGQDADLVAQGSLGISPEVGTFATTGQDAQLALKMPASGQAWTLTGQSGDFRVTLQTDHGAFPVAGQAALFDVLMPSEYRDIAYTGQAAAFNLSLTAEGTTFTLWSVEILDAQAGSFAVTGQDAPLALSMPAEAGLFELTWPQERLEAETATFTATGQGAGLSLAMPAEGAAYSVTGQDAGSIFEGTFVLDAEPGIFTLAGQNIGLAQTGAAGGYGRRRRRVILPDDTQAFVTEDELRELLEAYVRKIPQSERRKKKPKEVRITGAEVDKLILPEFEAMGELRVELPKRYVWRPDPALLAQVQARLQEIDETARAMRRRRLETILLMMD